MNRNLFPDKLMQLTSDIRVISSSKLEKQERRSYWSILETEMMDKLQRQDLQLVVCMSPIETVKDNLQQKMLLTQQDLMYIKIICTNVASRFGSNSREQSLFSSEKAGGWHFLSSGYIRWINSASHFIH